MTNQPTEVARDYRTPEENAQEEASIAATYQRRVETARQAAPVIRHPGKTHEEVLTWLLSQPGKLGLGDDEWDALRWAVARIADLTGDLNRYMTLLVAKDEAFRLLSERYAALLQQMQSTIDYHQQGAA